MWQENKGYRRSKILNKAILASQSDYIITIDNDVILHPKFIADHKKNARKGYFVAGRRSYITEDYAVKIKEGKAIRLPGFFSGNLKRRFSSLRIPLLSCLFYGHHRNSTRQLMGSNMAFWKSDFISVNGFEEEFVGWGSEDREFCLRMMNCGVRRRTLVFSAIQFHLDHPVRSVHDNLQANRQIFLKAKSSKKVRANTGIDQYE
nr:galactosyltransferase-related protein [Duncaniella sp.]